MQSLRYTAGYGALQRARDGGEVVIGGEGLPVARWALSDFDRDVMRRGLDGAAQILEAGGARKVYSSHAGWVSYEPGAATAAASRCSRRPTAAAGAQAQVTLGSFHLMGTARMGSSREDSVCDSDGEAWDVRGPVRGRRRGAADRPGGEPDGHDRGRGAQDRARDGGEARPEAA